jgi:hypothetical protein
VEQIYGRVLPLPGSLSGSGSHGDARVADLDAHRSRVVVEVELGQVLLGIDADAPRIGKLA